MTPLSYDIQRICDSVAPERWRHEEGGSVLDFGAWELRVHLAGIVRTFAIQVAVNRKDAPSGTAVPFFRELDRYGALRDERGRVTSLECSPPEWLRSSLEDAICWVQSAQ